MEHGGNVSCAERGGEPEIPLVLSQPLAGRLGLGAVGRDIVHLSGLHSSSLCISDPSNCLRKGASGRPVGATGVRGGKVKGKSGTPSPLLPPAPAQSGRRQGPGMQGREDSASGPSGRLSWKD